MSAITADALPRHKLTVDDFHRMGEAGIFSENDRIELIEGELIDRTPIGNRPATVVRKLIHLLRSIDARQAVLDVQNPIVLGLDSEPEPDLVLLRPRADFYAESMPRAADVLLLIEVSDTTGTYDRQIKLPLYARHRIPEVWIIDVNAGSLERYTEPTERGYGACETFDRQQRVAPSLLPEIQLELTNLL